MITAVVQAFQAEVARLGRTRDLPPVMPDLTELVVSTAVAALAAPRKAETPVALPGSTMAEVMAEIRAIAGVDLDGVTMALRAAIVCEIAAVSRRNLGEGQDSIELCLGHGSIPELPEASTRAGVAVVYRLPGTLAAPRVKVGLLGAGEGTTAGTAPIEAFLRGEGPAAGLEDLHGSPTRGYCAGHGPGKGSR